MNRLWRLLRQLFGEEPPLRPTGYGGHGHGRRHELDEQDEGSVQEASEQVTRAADDPPAPPQHHGH